MAELKDFALTNIDWEMTPEQAVGLYLEWGHNDRDSGFPPVRFEDDATTYFVIDSWESPPLIRLVRRTMADATDLLVMPLPPDLLDDWRAANGDLKGVAAPTPKIKAWLKKQLGQEDLAR